MFQLASFPDHYMAWERGYGILHTVCLVVYTDDMLHFVFSHTVNSNYYAMGVANPPTTHQLDRAAMHIYNSVM